MTIDGAAGTGLAARRMSLWRRHRLFVLQAAVVVAISAGVTMFQWRADRGKDGAAQLSAQLAEARRLVDSGQPVEAIDLYTAILADYPNQVEALAYGGWLMRLAGRISDDPAAVDKGLESIDRALRIDPSYADAHFFRGVILYRDKGDPGGAIRAFRASLASNPPAEMVTHVEKLLDEAIAALTPLTTTPP